MKELRIYTEEPKKHIQYRLFRRQNVVTNNELISCFVASSEKGPLFLASKDRLTKILSDEGYEFNIEPPAEITDKP